MEKQTNLLFDEKISLLSKGRERRPLPNVKNNGCGWVVMPNVTPPCLGIGKTGTVDG